MTFLPRHMSAWEAWKACYRQWPIVSMFIWARAGCQLFRWDYRKFSNFENFKLKFKEFRKFNFFGKLEKRFHRDVGLEIDDLRLPRFWTSKFNIRIPLYSHCESHASCSIGYIVITRYMTIVSSVCFRPERWQLMFLAPEEMRFSVAPVW